MSRPASFVSIVEKVEGVKISDKTDVTLADVILALEAVAKTADRVRKRITEERFPRFGTKMANLMKDILPEVVEADQSTQLYAPQLRWEELTDISDREFTLLASAHAWIEKDTGKTGAQADKEFFDFIQNAYADDEQMATAINIIKRAKAEDF